MALSTLGPGATNFTTAAAYSHLGAFPALFITGQKPILKSKQGAFQIVDTVNLFSRISKYSKQVLLWSLPCLCMHRHCQFGTQSHTMSKSQAWRVAQMHHNAAA